MATADRHLKATVTKTFYDVTELYTTLMISQDNTKLTQIPLLKKILTT